MRPVSLIMWPLLAMGAMLPLSAVTGWPNWLGKWVLSHPYVLVLGVVVVGWLSFSCGSVTTTRRRPRRHDDEDVGLGA